MDLLLEDLASADIGSREHLRNRFYLIFIEASSISFICEHQELHVLYLRLLKNFSMSF